MVGSSIINSSNNKLAEISEINGNKLTATAINNIGKIDLKNSNGMEVATNSILKKQSAKERFYAKADYARNNQQREEQQRVAWDSETEQLRNEVRFSSERIARDLLGEPNKNLSNRRELRFGKSGKMVVRISGEKADTWYDFSASKGRDLFALVEHKRGGSFKEFADYLRASIVLTSTSNLYIVHSHETNDKNAEEKAIEVRKIKYANSLYEKANKIGDRSIAKTYLSPHSALTIDTNFHKPRECSTNCVKLK